MADDRHPTLRALAQPDLRYFLTARFFGVMARMLLHASLVWHVFDVTRSKFWLGALGLVEFLPVIPMAMVGGIAADARDRRDVVWLAQVASALAALALWLGSGQTSHDLWLVLGAAFCLRVAWGFEFPAGQALLPALVPREIFQNAVVVSATVRNAAFVTGPVLAGFLIDAADVSAAYAASAALYAFSLVALLGVRRTGRAAEATQVGIAAVREGVAFVRSRPAILGAMTLDMLAVIFADPTVLLVVYSEEILAVGPRGYGLLYASMAMGTFAMTLLLLAVLAFGLAAITFGGSRWFPLSLAALVVAGMADQVSQVTRATIIQLSTPDSLRGRISAVNMVFISASNEFGAAFSGFLAAATSTVFAVVGGGCACLATVGVVAARVPALRHWRSDALPPQ